MASLASPYLLPRMSSPMKTTSIAAALLLALTSPAFAAKAKPRDFTALRKWQDLDFRCYRGVFPDDDIDVDPLPRRKEARHALLLTSWTRNWPPKGTAPMGRAGSAGPARNTSTPASTAPELTATWHSTATPSRICLSVVTSIYLPPGSDCVCGKPAILRAKAFRMASTLVSPNSGA